MKNKFIIIIICLFYTCICYGQYDNQNNNYITLDKTIVTIESSYGIKRNSEMITWQELRNYTAFFYLNNSNMQNTQDKLNSKNATDLEYVLKDMIINIVLVNSSLKLMSNQKLSNLTIPQWAILVKKHGGNNIYSLIDKNNLSENLIKKFIKLKIDAENYLKKSLKNISKGYNEKEIKLFYNTIDHPYKNIPYEKVRSNIIKLMEQRDMIRQTKVFVNDLLKRYKIKLVDQWFKADIRFNKTFIENFGEAED